MAGGKKKSLANKLAKMSDEERARYLQHKADMEEEAKRRKEQLIATFMKKKIKKEDAFSRLNLAKINQNWHQILRKAKCQEMNENVEHLKGWIERLLDYKNRTISKLMEELEEAEEQYSNNFQYHSTHIDNIIENQHLFIEKLQKEYEEDLCSLLETTDIETESILENAEIEQEHLKTILYGQEIKGAKTLAEQYENYMVKIYETEQDFQNKLVRLKTSREATCGALWRQIAAVVRLYVQKTDSRRMHLAELRRLDAESAVEIAENEDRITQEEALIDELESHYEMISSERESTIKKLEIKVDGLNKRFLKTKKDLEKDLQTDETKLYLLTECATESIEYLEKLTKKGKRIKNLATTCKKFETEREQVCKWLPITLAIRKYDGEETDFKESVTAVSEQLKDVENIQDTILSIHTIQDCALPILTLPESQSSMKKSPGRPKTAVSDSFPKSAHSMATTTPESKRITTVKAVTIQAKVSQEKEPSSSSSSESETSITSEKPLSNILERCYESLKNMENFWFVFNKVEIDYLEIKEEKRVLEEENKQMRGMLRAVLEAAALSQTIPNSRASTRLASKRRSAHSAPLRRLVFD